MAGDMLSVDQALANILAGAGSAVPTEMVPLAKAGGRTLTRNVEARRNQPPADVSAMDGYAVRAADLAAPLALVGSSQAGRAFDGTMREGQAIRIFTGANVPAGADTVLMQENAERHGDTVVALQAEPFGRHIRKAGLDFRTGEIGLLAGRRLGASELALAAAMNHAELPVSRKPRVAILATGDELVLPGGEPGPDQIVASNTFALAAIVHRAGGEIIDLGIAADTHEALDQSLAQAQASGADVLITLGGASVGDHDLVQAALVRAGMDLGFWKVAMRPGKPLMHGRLGGLRVLGLPGNPVSSIVFGVLFVRPLVRALCGDGAAGLPPLETARLGADLRANEVRQDYMRATLQAVAGDHPVATAASLQDSSMLRVMAGAQALIVRPPCQPAMQAGDLCSIIRLENLLG